MRYLRQAGVSIVLLVVFAGVSLIPRLPPPAYAADVPPPLPEAEDPLGQQPEQSIPEITIQVDARDGHPVVRAVDIWGPGRTPLVFRSYTNAQRDSSTLPYSLLAPPYVWSFNQVLDIVDVPNSTDRSVLEPDGNRSTYHYSSTRSSADGTQFWQIFVNDIGTYSTLEMRYACVPDPRGSALTTGCTWDGTHVRYLPKGVVWRYQGKKIVEMRDANGNATAFAYTTFADGSGTYLSTVTDPVGRRTTYGWEHAYETCVRRSLEGDCLQTKWVYRVRTITDPYGRTATYTYDAQSRLTGVTNGAGRTTSYGYQAQGLLSSVTNARGYSTTLQWAASTDAKWRVTGVTAPGNATTGYAYTVWEGLVLRTVVTNARGSATTDEMAAGGNLMKETDPLGNATQYAYDDRHNVTQVTDPRGNQTRYEYNSRNKVTKVIKAYGTLNLTTTLSWDGYDNLLSVTNPRGIRTEFTYDSRHNLTRVKRAAGTADESITDYTYTAWGGVATVSNPRSPSWMWTYTYTARRQVQTVTPPVGGQTSYGYDAFDDQTSMTNGNGKTWSTICDASRLVTRVTDPLGYAVAYAYDANGNRLRIFDAMSRLTTFDYDSRDRLTRITDPLNGQTVYDYDAVSNLARITNARGNATVFTYDAVNRLSQVTDALGQGTTDGYDPAGNRTSMRDRRGTTFTYAYDQANRLTQVSGGGLTVSYGYDADGNRTSLVDATGTTTYAYDNLDRLTRITYPAGPSVQTGYDRAGSRTSLVYPDGVTAAAYQYDGANRLTQITQGTLQWSFGYDSAGNRTLLVHPNGTRTAYTYVDNNWLSTISHQSPGGVPFETFTYGYDRNGNRTSQTDSTGTTTYGYDGLNRLTQAIYPGTYGTWSWTYDAVGNRTFQSSPSGSISYSYDANNRLTLAGSTTYAYDPNGNLTSTSAGPTYAYDPFNRMVQASGGGGTVSFTYNGDGLKVQRSGPDGVTRYYYDGIRPIWETDGAGRFKTQLDRDIFGNLLSRREASGTRYYYHHDGLGGTVALSAPDGSIAARILYDAWGTARYATASSTVNGNYLYTGAEIDRTVGLYHMGARFYDPSVGRWLSEDAIQGHAPNTLNFYTYVANNPLIYGDPSGLCDQACLEDLNARRQELAKKTENWSDYLTALELTRALETTLGRDKAYETAGAFLDKIAAGVDVGTALQESLEEALHPTSAGPGSSVPRDAMWQMIMGLYYESATFYGVGAIIETIAFFFWDRSKLDEYFRHVATSPFTNIGTALLVGGLYLDFKYFGAAVFSEFMRRWRR